MAELSKAAHKSNLDDGPRRWSGSCYFSEGWGEGAVGTFGLAGAFFAAAAFFPGVALEAVAAVFLAVDAGAEFRAAFLALRTLAQRFFWAAAIFSREAALRVRVVALAGLVKLIADGRPGLRFSVALTAVSNCLTCCSRDISASISETIAIVSINPPFFSITHV